MSIVKVHPVVRLYIDSIESIEWEYFRTDYSDEDARWLDEFFTTAAQNILNASTGYADAMNEWHKFIINERFDDIGMYDTEPTYQFMELCDIIYPQEVEK